MKKSEFSIKIHLLEKAATGFPYIVVFTYVAGFIFCMAIGNMNYLSNGSILAIPAVAASFIFLLIKRKDVDLSETTFFWGISQKASTTLFIVSYTLAVLVFSFTSIESKLALVGAIVLYTVVFVQILSRRLNPAVVLVEIMLALAVTIYSYTLRSALYFGSTDTMPHIHISTITYLTGHVMPSELSTYAYFPLYHLSIVVSSYILNLNVQTTLFVTTCLIYVSTVLFLYFVVDGVFRNERISLLIVLVYAMNANVLYYGTYMVTRTLAYVGFLILLYLLHARGNTKNDSRFPVTRPVARRILVIVAFIFILLTHQITMPMVIILLGALLILELFSRVKQSVNMVFLAVPVALFSVYWAFVAYSFLWQLLPHAEPSLYEDVIFDKVVYLGLSFLVNRIDMLLILFFALVGTIYLLWKQQPRYSIVFGIMGLVSVFLNVPNFLTTVFQFVEILRIDRYALLFLPFLAVVMGVGMYALALYLSSMKILSKVAGILLIALVVLYGIGSLGIVKDSEDPKRFYFNEDEIIGYQHVLRTVPSGSSLHSDFYTYRFFDGPNITNITSLELPYYPTHMMQDDLRVSGEEGYLIIPSRQFLQGGLLFGTGNEFDPDHSQPFLPTEENIWKMTRSLSGDDKVYSNSGVDIYRFIQ